MTKHKATLETRPETLGGVSLNINVGRREVINRIVQMYGEPLNQNQLEELAGDYLNGVTRCSQDTADEIYFDHLLPRAIEQSDNELDVWRSGAELLENPSYVVKGSTLYVAFSSDKNFGGIPKDPGRRKSDLETKKLFDVTVYSVDIQRMIERELARKHDAEERKRTGARNCQIVKELIIVMLVIGVIFVVYNLWIK